MQPSTSTTTRKSPRKSAAPRRRGRPPPQVADAAESELMAVDAAESELADLALHEPSTDDEEPSAAAVSDPEPEPEIDSADSGSGSDDDGSEYSEYSDASVAEESPDPEIEAFDRSDDESDISDRSSDSDSDYVPAADRPALVEAAQRTRRFRPGTVALREIRYYQKTTHLLIPKGSFQRLARDTLRGLRRVSVKRFTKSALLALQEASEDHIVRCFQRTQMASIHAGREVITVADMRHALDSAAT